MKLHNGCKYLISSFIIVACCLQQCCLGQSTTVRPYKFGFTIDQQQHRSEQRDERGIVMGEFGFITADGIYHVTVYATDEQGRFRILAMKNYPYESPPKTVEVMVKPRILPTTTTTPKPLTRHNFNTQACSGCFLTNGNTKTKGIEGDMVKNDIRPLAKDLPNTSSSSAVNSKAPKETPSTDTAAQENKVATISKDLNQKTLKTATKGSSGSSPTSSTENNNRPPIMDIIMQKVLPTLMGKKGQTASLSPAQSTTLTSNSNGAESPGQKPSLSKSGFDTIRKSGVGSSPSAVNADGDLYRFNYILDYHGHTETGKRNGDKEGSYYAIGDDNVERTIEYVANEFGYQPRIRWRKLNSNEIKPEENTLKDYEFIWFKQ